MDNAQISETLFKAFERNDYDTVKSLCAPGFGARQNGGDAMSLDAVITFAKAVNSVVTGFRYEDVVRAATLDGFVEEHAVRGTLPDGTKVELFVCVVATVNNGQITDLREYFDKAAAAPVAKALGAI